ncbi:MAG: DUF1844 domain-containing protein [Elusimicrobia bacterium]|nr:DUF1844 domain-containing protein [Elusimicrobiota bacterium]
MEDKDINQKFFGLITMFAGATWQFLGKVPNQMDGKISVDLKAAQMYIDVLEMLREKTKGNLTSKEESLLAETISSLQLNYADEAAKPQDKKEPAPPEACKCGCGKENCDCEKKDETANCGCDK